MIIWGATFWLSKDTNYFSFVLFKKFNSRFDCFDLFQDRFHDYQVTGLASKNSFVYK